MKRFKYLHNLNLIGYLITITLFVMFFVELFLINTFELNGGGYLFFICIYALIFLGGFHVLLSFILLTQWRNLNADCKQLLKVYFGIVAIYGIAFFLIMAFAGIFIYYMILLALGIATYFVAVTYMAKQMKVTKG